MQPRWLNVKLTSTLSWGASTTTYADDDFDSVDQTQNINNEAQHKPQIDKLHLRTDIASYNCTRGAARTCFPVKTRPCLIMEGS